MIRKICFLLLALCFNTSWVISQTQDSPANIEQALILLDSLYPDSIKPIIKITPDDSLSDLFSPYGMYDNPIFEWFSNAGDTSKTLLQKYYADLGITYPLHIETIILKAYKGNLLNKTLNHDELCNPYQMIEKKWNEEDLVRFTTDTLRGVYIPKDLEDCCKQIDKFWSDSIRTMVKGWKEDEFVNKAHFGFGMWMRNNWQLWGGSRLSKYFTDYGIFHPDDMSSIILTTYHRYLLKKNIDFEEQIKEHQEWWDNQRKNDELIEKQESPTILKTKKWLKKHNIPIYQIIDLQDRSVFYNCDSDIMLKKVTGDTIRYWTNGSETPMEIKMFKKIMHTRNFKTNSYVRDIYPDGRITVIDFTEHVFITKKDSLFEKDYYSDISDDSISHLYDALFKATSKSGRKIYEEALSRHSYTKFKLIFTPSMFYMVSNFAVGDINFPDEEIVLTGYWEINNTGYYRILIENKIKHTKYSYLFDDNFKFTYWEGCNPGVVKDIREDNKKLIISK